MWMSGAYLNFNEIKETWGGPLWCNTTQLNNDFTQCNNPYLDFNHLWMEATVCATKQAYCDISNDYTESK